MSAQASTAPKGWAAVRSGLTRRPSRGQWLVAVLLFGLGFGLAVQVRTTQEDSLEAARTSDLVRILDDLAAQRDRLTAEEARLRATLVDLQSSADQAQAAREATRERIDSLLILSGQVPVTGPGVALTISDQDGVLEATDLLDAVQELRDAGAEAISIDGQRVVAETALTDTAEGIAVGGEVVESPYQVLAIGPPGTLAAGLSFPGGVEESIREAGATSAVVEREEIVIPALP